MRVAWTIKRSQSKPELIAPYSSFEMGPAMRFWYRGIRIYWVQTATVRHRSRLASSHSSPRNGGAFHHHNPLLVSMLFTSPFSATIFLFVFAASSIASSHATAGQKLATGLCHVPKNTLVLPVVFDGGNKVLGIIKVRTTCV